MRISHRNTSALLLLLFLTGCASQGIKPEERDTSGKFDGIWVASAHIKEHMTRIDDFRLTCYENSFSLPLYITDGQLYLSSELVKGGGYIKEDGTFYFNFQFDKTKKSNMIENQRLILSGPLGVVMGEGDVVITYNHPTQGCKGKTTIVKN
jgi:hypothetical protein